LSTSPGVNDLPDDREPPVSATYSPCLVASLMPAWRAYRDATPELLAEK
jgi:hypothetical protein